MADYERPDCAHREVCDCAQPGDCVGEQLARIGEEFVAGMGATVEDDDDGPGR